MTSHRFAAIAALLLLTSHARGQTAFSDSRVQAPELKASQRGSLTGQLASTVFGPADVSRGAFSLAGPFDAPGERGAPLVTPFPSYSPDGPLSEWGMGWKTSLVVERGRVAGDLDFATDDLVGPWGRMVRGSDGSYYPQGLSPAVRLDASDPEKLVAYLPDGARWTFGGAERQTSPRGTFAWYLTDVEMPTGQVTRLAYDANASGRRFLSSVTYGGRASAPQHRLEIEYEPIERVVVDYRSGAAATLDRRVARVRALSWNKASGAFAERWRHTLVHETDDTGLAFFLTRVQKRYASGEVPPDAVYTYDRAKDQLATATAALAPHVGALASELRAQFFQPHKGAPLDVDDDGRPDIELASDQSLLVQKDGAFERVPLPASAAASPYCRLAPGVLNPPRMLARASESDPSALVWSFRGAGFGTDLTLCHREGDVVFTSRLAGAWAPGALTKLADLNRDHRPDLVQVLSGRYVVLPNLSDASAYAFGAEIRGALTPAFTPSAAWAEDMNGDGIADLVARSGAELTVWYGKGSFTFEEQGKTLRFFDGTVQVTGLADYTLTFTDANKDGLADVLLVKSNRYYLFTNQGAAFRRVAVPALSSVPSAAGQPVPIDLVGSGNTELVYSDGTDVKSVALDAPSTGLMVGASDGRGTALTFVYGRAPAAPGVRVRHAVLRQLQTRAVGEEAETFEYDYEGARLHSVGRFLVGYDKVTRRGPTDTSAMTFLNEDRYAGVLLASVESDVANPRVQRVDFRSYEDAESFGVPWKRLRSEGRGFASTDPLAPRVSLEQTTVSAYEREVCPASVSLATEHGTLATTTTYTVPARLERHLSCLSRHVTLEGTHAVRGKDFAHALRVDRDDRGLVTMRTLEGARGDLVDQQVTYTDDGLVATIMQPGQGTTLIAYDDATRMPASVHMPDGSLTVVSARDALTDAALDLTVDRGALAFHQHFRFDGLERLASSWNDLGAASEATPGTRLAYRYADLDADLPAMVRADVLASVTPGGPTWKKAADLSSGAGSPLASLTLVPEGWAVSSLHGYARTQRRTDLLVRAPVPGDVAALHAGALYEGAQRVASAVSSLFGVASESRTTYHVGVEDVVAGALGIADGLALTLTENGELTTVKGMDASMRTRDIVDAGGAHYRFGYDALGRVRDVTLPTGERHVTSFDEYGRVASVDREGVARVEYGYDPATGLAVDKRFLGGTDGALVRRVTLDHDASGRVVKETHTDAGGAEESVRYFYDGATLAEPDLQDRAGLLTGVAGPGFSKQFEARADGTPLRTVLTIDGFRTLTSSFTYDEDGARRSTTTTVTDPAGAVISSVTVEADRDAFGRPGRILLGGDELASYGYDADGIVAWAAFGGSHANREVVTFQRDPATRRNTGSNVSTVGWHASTSSRMNARGLVGAETFDVGDARRDRTYAYAPAGYLVASTDAVDRYTYAYDASGVPASSARGDDTLVHRREGDVLRAGAHHHRFDSLGRVIERDGVQMVYGPRGQIRDASDGERQWSYLYDEAGQRLAKLAGGRVVAAFPRDGSYLDAALGLIEPLVIADRVVGVVHHGVAGTSESTRFEAMMADARGTRLSNVDGTSSFASPFGARDVHPDMAAAIDYATKGWDADLGVVRMGVRDYDPALQRFLQPDPLFLEHPEKCVDGAIDCNLYAYARNNPLSFVDPTGLDPDEMPTWKKGVHLALGIAYGTVQALVPGGVALNPPAQSKYFEVGKAGGQIATGITLMVAGSAGEAGSAVGGVVTSETGVGAVAGMAGVVVCDAVRVQGAVMATAGVVNLMAALKGGGGSLRSSSPAGASPEITHEDLGGKTPEQLRELADDKGLVPHPTKPDKWVDPATGKERLRLDPGHTDTTTGKPYDDPKAAVPHAHGYEPDGKTKVRDPVDNNPHFPTK